MKYTYREVHISFFCFVYNRFYFLEQFYVHSNIEQKVQRFPIFSLSHISIATATPLPQLTSSRVVRLLQLVNLHLHIIITQSPQLTLGFTLGVVYSMDLKQCIITCIHHYRNIQSIFTALKILSTLPPHLSPGSHNCAS